MSILALCRILTHCITTGDDRLTKITVRAENINCTSHQFGESHCVMSQHVCSRHSYLINHEGIQTRSQRAALSSQQQWTEVLLPVKIVKLLVSDIQNILESQAPPEEDGDRDSSSSEVILNMEMCLHISLWYTCIRERERRALRQR